MSVFDASRLSDASQRLSAKLSRFQHVITWSEPRKALCVFLSNKENFSVVPSEWEGLKVYVFPGESLLDYGRRSLLDIAEQCIEAAEQYKTSNPAPAASPVHHTVECRIESTIEHSTASHSDGSTVAIERIVPRTIVTYTVYLPPNVEAEFKVRRVAK